MSFVAEKQDPSEVCNVCGQRADTPCVGIARVKAGIGCVAQIHDECSPSYGIRHSRILAMKGDHTHVRPIGK